MSDELRWYLLTTDPNVQDEFNRFIVIEDIGDPLLDDKGDQVVDEEGRVQFHYNTYMVHQERDNVQGFSTGDWWERDRFEVARHLIIGHYRVIPDQEVQEPTEPIVGWQTDKLVILSGPPKFLQWESVEMPDEFAGVDPKKKALVVRDLEAEKAELARP